MGFPELIMQFHGVDEEVKIHVNGKETLWDSEHRECNPPADQLERPVPENQAHLCFTDALGRKTYLRADVVSDVSSLNSTTEAYFNQYQGLGKLIKVLFIDVFPINHFVNAEAYKLADKGDNKISKDISKKAWTELKEIKMRVEKTQMMKQRLKRSSTEEEKSSETIRRPSASQR